MIDTDPEPLRGITVRDCWRCRGRGQVRGGGVCPACKGHRVIILKNNRPVDLDAPKRRQGRPPDPHEIS